MKKIQLCTTMLIIKNEYRLTNIKTLEFFAFYNIGSLFVVVFLDLQAWFVL
jgi:hypothetical protein